MTTGGAPKGFQPTGKGCRGTAEATCPICGDEMNPSALPGHIGEHGSGGSPRTPEERL